MHSRGAPLLYLLSPTSPFGTIIAISAALLLIVVAVFVVPSLLLMWWLSFAAEHVR